jgi:hypothetical protein
VSYEWRRNWQLQKIFLWIVPRTGNRSKRFKKVNNPAFSAKDVRERTRVSVEQRTPTPLSASIRTKNTPYHEAPNALTPHDSSSVPWRRPFRRPRSSRDVIHRRQTQFLPRNWRVECAKRHWFWVRRMGDTRIFSGIFKSYGHLVSMFYSYRRNLPKRFRDFSNKQKKTNPITLSGIPDHISPSRTALPNMNTMKFVVVVLFSLIGSASAAVSQADCATLSAYMRCQASFVGSAEADCDTSICKWSGSSCAPSDATMTATQSLGAAGSGWATLEAEKLALCKADADCSILAANVQTVCLPTCQARTLSICSDNDGTEPCNTHGNFVQSDDCISSGFMTNDYKVSGASSIMASTVILAFIAAGLATFA